MNLFLITDRPKIKEKTSNTSGGMQRLNTDWSLFPQTLFIVKFVLNRLINIEWLKKTKISQTVLAC